MQGFPLLEQAHRKDHLPVQVQDQPAPVLDQRVALQTDRLQVQVLDQPVRVLDQRVALRTDHRREQVQRVLAFLAQVLDQQVASQTDRLQVRVLAFQEQAPERVLRVPVFQEPVQVLPEPVLVMVRALVRWADLRPIPSNRPSVWPVLAWPVFLLAWEPDPSAFLPQALAVPVWDRLAFLQQAEREPDFQLPVPSYREE